MRVQAHVAVAVVDDQQQAVAGHPFGVDHLTVGDRLDRTAGAGADQQAIAAAAVGHGATVTGQQRARHRPAQAADLQRGRARHLHRRARGRRTRGRARLAGVDGVAGRLRGFSRCGGLALRFARGRRAQLAQQLLQALGVAAQRFLARAAVLITRVELRDQRHARLAVLLQLPELVALLPARAVELRLARSDVAFQRIECA